MAEIIPSSIYYVLTPTKSKPGEDVPAYYTETFVDMVDALFYYRDCLADGNKPIMCQHLGVTINGDEISARDINGRGGRVKV